MLGKKNEKAPSDAKECFFTASENSAYQFQVLFDFFGKRSLLIAPQVFFSCSLHLRFLPVHVSNAIPGTQSDNANDSSTDPRRGAAGQHLCRHETIRHQACSKRHEPYMQNN